MPKNHAYVPERATTHYPKKGGPKRLLLVWYTEGASHCTRVYEDGSQEVRKFDFKITGQGFIVGPWVQITWPAALRMIDKAIGLVA